MSARMAVGLLVSATVAAATCTAEQTAKPRITAAELLDGEVLAVSVVPTGLVDGDRVLAVDAAMMEFLAAEVDPRAVPGTRLFQLARAMIDSESFGLRFDSRTRTAAEAFHERRGNCLSFSNLFVAMARQVGLDASFQEVDVPADWSQHDDVFVLNRHVNVRVSLGPAGERVVDFNTDDFRESYATRTISDERALAHYFNNIGVERMQAGDVSSAFLCFRRALGEADRRFSPAWTNLGTLYLRLGHPDHAEAAYHQALRVERGDTVAMSNLARLYERQGRPEASAEFRARVERHRNRNPYFRYERAREAYAAGEWDVAIEHLKHAVRRERGEERFLNLLGECFLAKGDDRRARRWFARARRLSAADPDARAGTSEPEAVAP